MAPLLHTAATTTGKMKYEGYHRRTARPTSCQTGRLSALQTCNGKIGKL